jgi:hypothetical protein
MDAEHLTCPDCGAALERSAVNGGMRYVCPACHGFGAGAVVLRRMLAEGVETAIWLASEDVAPSGPGCPWCGHPLRPVAPPLAPAPVAVCRTCEMLWIPAASAGQLPAGQAAAPSHLAPAVTDRCPNCGAPWMETPDGSCRFCHAAVVAPQIVVLSDH